MADGYGFLRAENFLPGTNDIYIAPAQIRRFNLKTGDCVRGIVRESRDGERFDALIYVKTVNGTDPLYVVDGMPVGTNINFLNSNGTELCQRHHSRR